MRCVVIVILLLSSAAFYANAAEDRIVEFVTKAGTAEIAFITSSQLEANSA